MARQHRHMLGGHGSAAPTALALAPGEILAEDFADGPGQRVLLA
jgi:hypothetical protein